MLRLLLLLVVSACGPIPEGAFNPYCWQDCVATYGDGVTVSSTFEKGPV